MYVKNEEELQCPVYNSFSVQNIGEVGLVPTKEQFFCPSNTEDAQHFMCSLSACVCLEVEGNSPNLWTFDKTNPQNQRLLRQKIILTELASEML